MPPFGITTSIFIIITDFSLTFVELAEDDLVLEDYFDASFGKKYSYCYYEQTMVFVNCLRLVH